MKYLVDSALVFIFLGCLFSGYKKGFVRTVLKFILTLVATVGSWILAKLMAPWVFYTFLRASVISKIEKSLAATSAKDLSEAVTAAIPAPIAKILFYQGITQQKIHEILNQSGASAAAAAADAVAPIFISFLQVILGCILFLILMLVVRLIIRVVNRVFSLPVLRQINKVFGAVFGLLQGILITVIICFLIRFFLPLLPVNTAEFIERSFQASFLYSEFLKINISQFVMAKITGFAPKLERVRFCRSYE